MDKTIKKFTVIRSKWARGGENGDAALLNNSGNMCCLGFFSKECGADDNQLFEKEYPSYIEDFNIPEFLTESDEKGFRKEYKIAKINDSKEISDEEREAQLIKYFGKFGIELNFID